MSRPQRRPPKTGAANQRDLSRVCGLSAVSALFARGSARVERLFFLPELRRDVEPFCRQMSVQRRPFRQVAAAELGRIAGTVLHGGVVAIAQPRGVLEFDPVAAASWIRAAPLLLVLDGVGNPHNFGAIARTAAFFGLDRMVLSGDPAQAGPSDAVHRVAEGGLEFIQLYRAPQLPVALKRLKPAYRVVGTALERGRPLAALKRDQPIALVLGNEETGIGRPTLAVCDDIVTIPGSGAVQSLNVAATAAILIHVLGAQREVQIRGGRE